MLSVIGARKMDRLGRLTGISGRKGKEMQEDERRFMMEEVYSEDRENNMLKPDLSTVVPSSQFTLPFPPKDQARVEDYANNFAG